MKYNRVYLAGPEVFHPRALELAKMKKDICAAYKLEGVFPLDNELDVDSYLLKHQAGLAIGDANEKLIQSSNIIIANLTPFRGPSADVGTVYEVGYGRALGKRVFGYSNVPQLFESRTREFAGGGSTAADEFGMSFEDFGMHDNLMIETGIVRSGGAMITRAAKYSERFTDLYAFEQCVQLAARDL